MSYVMCCTDGLSSFSLCSYILTIAVCWYFEKSCRYYQNFHWMREVDIATKISKKFHIRTVTAAVRSTFVPSIAAGTLGKSKYDLDWYDDAYCIKTIVWDPCNISSRGHDRRFEGEAFSCLCSNTFRSICVKRVSCEYTSCPNSWHCYVGLLRGFLAIRSQKYTGCPVSNGAGNTA